MIEGTGSKLRRLLAGLDGGVQAIYEEFGAPFRPRFYPIVRLLLENGETNVGGIAEATGVTQPAATQTVNEMKKLRLVEVATGADRRARTVRLTPEGRHWADRLAPVWEAVHRAAENLDAELPVGLTEILNAALAALERQPFRDRIAQVLGDDL